MLLFWKIQAAVQDFLEAALTAIQSGSDQLRPAQVDVSTRQNFRRVCEFSTTRLVSGGPLASMRVDEPITDVPAT